MMENAIFLAKIIGPCMVIVAAGIMLNRENYHKMIEDFFKNAGLVYLSGVITLVYGLLMVLSYNVWAADWTLIITLLGWLTLIKGVWLIVLPDSLAKISAAYQKNTRLLTLHLVVILALGVFLSFKGYFCA